MVCVTGIYENPIFKRPRAARRGSWQREISSYVGTSYSQSFYKISKFSSARILLWYHTSNAALFVHEDRRAR
ncbi:hypothetical protein WG66_001729 [Moniliophthora roreri]|nr:hypothetical protein WG66_001729 [Moniliophthora roreri]